MKSFLLPSCLLLTLFSGTVNTSDLPVQLAKLESAGIPAQATTTSHWNTLNPKKLKLKSAGVLVLDQNGEEVYSRQVNEPRPIASITKLMTAMVILDSDLDLQEKVTITKDDRDLIQLTGSRLKYGAALTRKQMLQLALMSSENRAANALARTWPQGKAAFVEAMNKKAAALGMQASHFNDPAGLDPGNVASAYDWDIQLSKTGYLNESGRCLVMQAEIDNQSLTIVLLDSFGKLTPFGDSNRIRKWIESGS
jgi:D-alanyl-D-alanine endopeptidase (penicillin-binding protein 7)